MDKLIIHPTSLHLQSQPALLLYSMKALFPVLWETYSFLQDHLLLSSPTVEQCPWQTPSQVRVGGVGWPSSLPVSHAAAGFKAQDWQRTSAVQLRVGGETIQALCSAALGDTLL